MKQFILISLRVNRLGVLNWFSNLLNQLIGLNHVEQNIRGYSLLLRRTCSKLNMEQICFAQ